MAQLTLAIITTALLSVFLNTTTKAQQHAEQEYYELRSYSFTSSDQRVALEHYWENAAMPTFNRMGIESVGVFREMESGDIEKLYVLIPYKSLQQYDSVQRHFLQEVAHQKAGTLHLDAPFTAPAFDRVESSLMRAFTHMSLLETPEQKDRIFELRIYESHSEKAAQQKIKMFNEGGEIEIFREVGLQPVFFGETIIGSQMPNLTYMVTAPSMEEHQQNWKEFGGHPDWKSLSSLPEYKDTVSNITSIFLVPTEFSQI